MVRYVCHTDIEVWEITLKHISLDNLEAVGEGSALEAALELEDHTGVKLDCNDRFSGFQKLLRQVSSTGANLEDNISALDA